MGKLKVTSKWDFFYLLSFGMVGTITEQDVEPSNDSDRYTINKQNDKVIINNVDEVDINSFPTGCSYWIINKNGLSVKQPSITLTEMVDGHKIKYGHNEITVYSKTENSCLNFGLIEFLTLSNYVGFDIKENLTLMEEILANNNIISRLTTLDKNAKIILNRKISEMKEFIAENFIYSSSEEFNVILERDTGYYSITSKCGKYTFSMTTIDEFPIIYSESDDDDEHIIKLILIDKTLSGFLNCNIESIIEEFRNHR